MSSSLSKSSGSPDSGRCKFLHELYLEIDQWTSSGTSFQDAIRRAHRRQNAKIFKRGKLSRGSLIRLYYKWRVDRSAASLRLNYKPGVSPIPVALAEEFLNRLVAERVVSASAAMQSIRIDWRLGRSIPGLGTWQEYTRRKYGQAGSRLTPPEFPHSTRSLMRCLGSSGSSEYGKRITAALRAQRELNRFIDFIESRRTALATRRRHEPLGTPSISQHKPTNQPEIQ